MWLAWSFVALGFLMGNLVGLSADSLAKSLLGLLFAFIGGSVIAFLRRLTDPDRRLAGQAMLGLALGCLLGVYAGIVVTQYQLLTPPAARAAVQPPADSTAPVVSAARQPNPYIRSEVLRQSAGIDARLTTGALTHAQAYRELLDLVQAATRAP